MTSLGAKLAEGRTSDIYAWGEHQILKLAKEWVSRGSVEYELHIAQIVQAAGLPVPAVGEMLEIGGRLGLVYERVDGISLGERLRARPWLLVPCARRLAELHAQVHAAEAPPELPTVHEVLHRQLLREPALPPQLLRSAQAALDALPAGEALCHGDFHPFNILLGPKGPVVIDWNNAMRGRPLADLARTWVTHDRWFSSAYRKRYSQLRPVDREQFHRWCGVFAAANATEGIPHVVRRALALARKHLP